MTTHITGTRGEWLAAPAARLVIARHTAPIALTALAYFVQGGRPSWAIRGPVRWTAPAILGGMMLCPWRHRAGNLLAAAGAAAALTSQGAAFTVRARA